MPDEHKNSTKATGATPDEKLAPETRIVMVGASVATILGTLGTALLAVVDPLDDLAATTKIGLFGILAVALMAATIMVVADLNTRTKVKVAQIAAAARPSELSAAPGGVSSTALEMAVEIEGDTDRHAVLALRQDAQVSRCT